MPDTEILFKIDGVSYAGWEDVRVTRSLESMSGEFSLTVSHLPESWDDYPVQSSVELEVNGKTLLTGWIDTIRPSYGAETSYISISGRDKVGDLLDCAASVNDAFEFNGQKLEKVIASILKPYNIPLTVNVDTGAPIKRLAIQAGETAFDFIERACRLRAILPVSDGIGGLVLTKPSTEKSVGRLIYGQNILSGEAEIDWTERFSLYVVKGQSEALGDFSTAEEVSQPEGRATDEAVKRYRPTVILSEAQGYDLSLQQRAEWQRSFNKARSKRLSYTVQGFHSDVDGHHLWLPNQIVSVSDPRLKVSSDMLIVSVEYSKSAAGSISTLTLALPEAFNLPAEKEKENASVWEEFE